MPSLPPRWRAAELLAPTADLARALLGSYLYRRTAQGLIIATITETEAYGGIYDGHPDDASHAFRGRTDRNAPMFAAPGIIYVYLVYGMHHCVNIVTEREGTPAAVLLRGVRILHGLEIARRLRGQVPDARLSNGPGKLAQALALTRRDDGRSLLRGDLVLRHGAPPPAAAIHTEVRQGIDYAPWGKTFPWRFIWSKT